MPNKPQIHWLRFNGCICMPLTTYRLTANVRNSTAGCSHLLTYSRLLLLVIVGIFKLSRTAFDLPTSSFMNRTHHDKDPIKTRRLIIVTCDIAYFNMALIKLIVSLLILLWDFFFLFKRIKDFFLILNQIATWILS